MRLTVEGSGPGMLSRARRFHIAAAVSERKEDGREGLEEASTTDDGSGSTARVRTPR